MVKELKERGEVTDKSLMAPFWLILTTGQVSCATVLLKVIELLQRIDQNYLLYHTDYLFRRWCFEAGKVTVSLAESNGNPLLRLSLASPVGSNQI